MCPSYFRIRLPIEEAMTRFSNWIGREEILPPIQVMWNEAHRKAVDANGHWLGSVVYVFHRDGWTVFEDLSGHLGAIPADQWRQFAIAEDFVYAGCNDVTRYGELIVIQDGVVQREFLFMASDPQRNVNMGHLPHDPTEPYESWIQVEGFIDDDRLPFSSESGHLWIHEVSKNPHLHL